MSGFRGLNESSAENSVATDVAVHAGQEIDDHLP